MKIIDFLKDISINSLYGFEESKLDKYSIPDIIRISLNSVFNIEFSGNNVSNFIADIDNISDEELVIMLAALLNIY